MRNYLPKIIGFVINVIGLFSKTYAAKLAIKLFGTPRKGRLNKDEQYYLKSSIQATFSCHGFEIQTYKWEGTKESIVLAHGWESNTFRWKNLITRLTDLDYTVISLDGPAHGNSSGNHFNTLEYSDCLAEVVKMYNASIVIGHSVGGMAVIFSAYNHQLPSIHKFVLLGAPSNFSGVLKRYSDMMGYSKRVLAGIRQTILKEFKYPPEYFSSSEFSKSIKAKSLIIHDKKDPIIPFSDAIDYKNSFPNSKLIDTVGYGHSLKSDDVYIHITQFLID